MDKDKLRTLITKEMREAALDELAQCDERYGIAHSDIIDDLLISALAAAPKEFVEQLTTGSDDSERSRESGTGDVGISPSKSR